MATSLSHLRELPAEPAHPSHSLQLAQTGHSTFASAPRVQTQIYASASHLNNGASQDQ